MIVKKRVLEARSSSTSNAVIKLILKKFSDFYEELYNSPSEEKTEGYYEMLDLFDRHLLKECKPLIEALAYARHDAFSSNRECVALTKALIYYGLYIAK